MRAPAQIKRLPDDFRVEEIMEPRTGPGPFSLYRLSKRSLGTLEAVDLIARTWNLRPRDIQYAGMKDRHAQTQQYITIRGGPRDGLMRATVDLVYLGSAPRPVGPSDIVGNRFRIVLRKIRPANEAAIADGIEAARRLGVPNYFDDQRFRSLGPSREFVARAWCDGNYERALWLSLAEENPSDDSAEKQQKELLRLAWGEWPRVKESLARSHRRSIVTYLADHPADFRGAFERVRVELRRIYLVAFQSHIWNGVLAEIVRERADRCVSIPHAFGELPVHAEISEHQQKELEQLRIPLPAARTRYADADVRARFAKFLEPLGLTLESLRVKHGRDAFFPTAARPALSRAGELAVEWSDDALHPGHRAAALSFVLGRGSYATIVLKRAMAGAVMQGTVMPGDSEPAAEPLE